MPIPTVMKSAATAIQPAISGEISIMEYPSNSVRDRRFDPRLLRLHRRRPIAAARQAVNMLHQLEAEADEQDEKSYQQRNARRQHMHACDAADILARLKAAPGSRRSPPRDDPGQNKAEEATDQVDDFIHPRRKIFVEEVDGDVPAQTLHLRNAEIDDGHHAELHIFVGARQGTVEQPPRK